MSTHPANAWEILFPPPASDANAVHLSMRLLRRHGQPLLLIPSQTAAARAALGLYPAQSWKARLARNALHWALGLGLKTGTEPCELRFDADAPFARFLRPPESTSAEPSFALLLGNPNAAGRRFILLTFTRNGLPGRVVKAGAGAEAMTLIRRERNFIRQQTASRLHAPAVLDEFDGETVAAVAFEYAAGVTPRPDATGPLSEILAGWLDTGRMGPFSAFAAAQRLEACCPTDPTTRRLLALLNRIVCCPAIHHGDFAPWNIRVNETTGQWRVLDWERSDSFGPPAWDWFHYVIQPLVLVQHAPPAAILKHVTLCWNSPAFKRYAQKAAIESHFDLLLLGYLLHCRDVIQQAEGMATLRALTEQVQARVSASA